MVQELFRVLATLAMASLQASCETRPVGGAILILKGGFLWTINRPSLLRCTQIISLGPDLSLEVFRYWLNVLSSLSQSRQAFYFWG